MDKIKKQDVKNILVVLNNYFNDRTFILHQAYNKIALHYLLDNKTSKRHSLTGYKTTRAMYEHISAMLDGVNAMENAQLFAKRRALSAKSK